MVEIVYWSGTGNTEAMANEIEAAVKAAGADVESVRFEDTNVDDVASKDVILLGCPAMGSEELEDSVVEPFFTDLAPKLKGKKVGLFGSYGWGSGEWMEERAKTRIHKSLIFVESSRFQVQKDSLKDYLNEKPTHTEIEYNKIYPAFGKSTDKEFEDWRKEYKRFHLF